MMLFPVMPIFPWTQQKMAGNRRKLQNTMNDELQMDFHGATVAGDPCQSNPAMPERQPGPPFAGQ